MNEINLTKVKPTLLHTHIMSKGETKALRDLSKDKSITIKPADYITEAHRQLDDTNTYQKMTEDPTPKYLHEVNTKIDAMVTKSEITQPVANILKIKKPRTSQIYFLPKIHKEHDPPWETHSLSQQLSD